MVIRKALFLLSERAPGGSVAERRVYAASTPGAQRILVELLSRLVHRPLQRAEARAPRRGERGSLMTELVVAIAILTFGLLPLSYSIVSEKRFARATYQRAVAMELVDGELEVLAAGDWRTFAPGTNVYSVSARAATNLPAGNFVLTVAGDRLTLRWLPSEKQHGGSVTREVMIK